MEASEINATDVGSRVSNVYPIARLLIEDDNPGVSRVPAVPLSDFPFGRIGLL
jgi:hypothetical protein